MVQTNQSRLFSADCYKDSYKDNFSFKIKDQKKDTLSYRSSKRHTKFQRPLYFRNCNSAGWFWQFKNTANKQRFYSGSFQDRIRWFQSEIIFDFKKEPLEKYTITFYQAH
jgi:hypothetical protein